jgi:serine/threonine-protein kinase ATR
MQTMTQTVSKLLPFAAEASWATGRWEALEKYTSMASKENGEDFNVSLGRSLLLLKKTALEKDSLGKDALAGAILEIEKPFKESIRSLREQIAQSLSPSTTSSLSVSHDNMLKLHVLTELEMIAGTGINAPQPGKILESLDRRLEVIGAYLNDKQYLLGIRRAVMQLSRFVWGNSIAFGVAN